jgi:flagellar capping protein FliD
MADVNNVFGGVKSLGESNTKWIKTSQNLMDGLVEGIQEHLDNVENVIKDVKDGKIDCNMSDLENIYSTRLDVYEAIVNLMTKINEAAKTDMKIQTEMYGNEYRKYKDIFEVLKHTDPKSQI